MNYEQNELFFFNNNYLGTYGSKHRLLIFKTQIRSDNPELLTTIYLHNHPSLTKNTKYGVICLITLHYTDDNHSKTRSFYVWCQEINLITTVIKIVYLYRRDGKNHTIIFKMIR